MPDLKKKISILVLVSLCVSTLFVFFCFWCLDEKTPEIGSTAMNASHNCNPALTEYVQFIQNSAENPREYILNLFNEYDIVVVCERAHSEITQYDLIKSVISDERFIGNVGHVFLELGNFNLQAFVEDFLMNDSLSPVELDEKVFHILRNGSSSPVMTETYYYNFFKDIYNLNKSLPMEKRIHLYPSNMPFSWEGLTSSNYWQLKKNRPKVRDSVIAEQIIGKFNKIIHSGYPRKKALVIMNYRHAFPHLEIQKDSTIKHIYNVAGYLMDAFPGSVANVLLNSFKLLDGTTDTDIKIGLIQDGKWDAAFAFNKDCSLGFDFKGSPFGQDKFDYFPSWHNYKYEDIFTGFVFFEPLGKHILRYGQPGVFDAAFEEEFFKRHKIINKEISSDEIKDKIIEFSYVREYQYDIFGEREFEKLKHRIKMWLDKE